MNAADPRLATAEYRAAHADITRPLFKQNESGRHPMLQQRLPSISPIFALFKNERSQTPATPVCYSGTGRSWAAYAGRFLDVGAASDIYQRQWHDGGTDGSSTPPFRLFHLAVNVFLNSIRRHAHVDETASLLLTRNRGKHWTGQVLQSSAIRFYTRSRLRISLSVNDDLDRRYLNHSRSATPV